MQKNSSQFFRTSVVLSTALLLCSTLPVPVLAALPFKTAVAEQRNTAQVHTLDAVIEAVHRSTVSAETQGRITEINFDVDDTVAEGEVLIRITSAEQQAELSAAKAGVREAQARLNEAELEFGRVKDLHQKKLVPKSQLDSASANLKAMKQRLSSARAKLKQASEKLKYTSIRAPFSGVVVERLVQTGEAVKPGTPVMTGISLKSLRAAAQIPQSLVGIVRTNPAVTVAVPGTGQTAVTAASLQVKPATTGNSHSFTLRAVLPENIQGIYPGMMAKLSFATGESPRLVIDQSAVVQRSELTAVYVVNGEQVSFRQVRTGRRDGDGVEILSGLVAGEEIALDPVRAGIYVREQKQGSN
jgi:RND family efflux transporter MFP subunit